MSREAAARACAVLLAAALALALAPASTLADEARVRAEREPSEGERLYRDGHYERAIAWWRAAAARGDGGAAYRLGVVYADGVVAPQQLEEAARWYRLGAERGDCHAQFELAWLYDEGLGVSRSYTLAARWYLSAAEQGEPGSQHNLASMYEQGHGVARDLVAAYTWYALAEHHGLPVHALGAFERLEAELDSEELERARAQARRFEAAEACQRAR